MMISRALIVLLFFLNLNNTLAWDGCDYDRAWRCAFTRWPIVSAEQRSSTTRLRCGAATTSRVKGEEKSPAGATFGSVMKTEKEGGSAPSAMGRL